MSGAYTVFEIDQMRSDVKRIMYPTRWDSRYNGVTNYNDSAVNIDLRIEARLRTYMLSGIRPEELTARAKEVEAEGERRRKSFPETEAA